MKSPLKRTVVFSVGAIFIPVGVAGLVLPLLSGILFLALGVVLMSISSPTFRTWIERHTIKYPMLHSFVRKIEKRVVAIVGE